MSLLLNIASAFTVQFWAVNALNLGDAMLTHVAFAYGAVEANPLVRVIGLPGKIVLVLVASFLVDKIHPKSLWVVTPALSAVIFYSSFHLVFV